MNKKVAEYGRGNPLDALSIKQVAEALGVTQRYVMTLIANGKLEGSFVLGHMRFVPRSSVERLQLQRSNPSSTPNLNPKESSPAVAQ
jgi:excisionase family DNA binding protein